MVARITFGREIEKAIQYNEDKIAERQAVLLEASGMNLEPGDLRVRDKIAWLKELANRNRNVKKNAVHIVLSFHPSEQLSKQTLKEIACRYMEKIGFNDQPYLLYQHTDTKHPHLHVVTTNVRYDGSRIQTHWLGANVSEPARKEIEEEFGLIQASGRGVENEVFMQPLAVEALRYGEREMKAAISNVVREVVQTYRFSSLEELNQVLNQFGITVDAGEDGSRLKQFGGLLYSMVDGNGFKIGKPIKASSIYTKPTLARLKDKMLVKHKQKANFKGRLVRILEDALRTATTRQEFIDAVEKFKVKINFHLNSEGRMFGVTFIDNLTRCVFKGSELKKSLSVGAIAHRLLENGNPEYQYNFLYTRQVLGRSNLTQPDLALIRRWNRSALKFIRYTDSAGGLVYFAGHRGTSPASFVPISAAVGAILENATNLSAESHSKEKLLQDNNFLDAAENALYQGFIYLWDTHAALLDPIYVNTSTPHELLREAKKKKKKRRR